MDNKGKKECEHTNEIHIEYGCGCRAGCSNSLCHSTQNSDDTSIRNIQNSIDDAVLGPPNFAPSPSLQELIDKRLGVFDAQTDDEKLPNTIKEGNRWLKEHKNEHLFSHECYGEPMYDLDRDKIRDFLQAAITESYEAGQENGANGKFFSAVEITEPLPKHIYDKIFEEGRRATTSAIVEKVKEMRPSVEAIGDAPGNSAVGSEHRAFGYNVALDDLTSWLSQDH